MSAVVLDTQAAACGLGLVRLHFNTLSQSERAAAIRRMASEGMSTYTIAAATGLAVEFIKQLTQSEGATS